MGENVCMGSKFLFSAGCANLAAHNSTSDCWKRLSVKKLAHVVGCQCLSPPHNIVFINTVNPCIDAEQPHDVRVGFMNGET